MKREVTKKAGEEEKCATGMLNRGESERWAFLAEHVDRAAEAKFEYQLFYYPADQSVELYDIRNRRPFLKRVRYDALRPSELYPGNTVTIYSRQLTITAYGDERTRSKLASQRQKALVVIPPAAFNRSSGTLRSICGTEDLSLGSIVSMNVPSSTHDLDTLAPLAASSDTLQPSSGTCVAAELVGDHSIERVKRVCDALGHDTALAACDDEHAASKAISFAHSQAAFCSARLRECTLGVIKPHAVKAGYALEILEHVQHELGGISAVQSFRLSKPNAGEFLEVYKGVAPEYAHMVYELSSGMCIAFEVSSEAHDYRGAGVAENVVEALRNVCGPADPEIAKALRPNSIRARFGQDKVNNAVHCTDLAEDGPLESEYFFSVLASQ